MYAKQPRREQNELEIHKLAAKQAKDKAQSDLGAGCKSLARLSSDGFLPPTSNKSPIKVARFTCGQNESHKLNQSPANESPEMKLAARPRVSLD